MVRVGFDGGVLITGDYGRSRTTVKPCWIRYMFIIRPYCVGACQVRLLRGRIWQRPARPGRPPIPRHTRANCGSCVTL